MNPATTDQRIRALRPPKPYVDPYSAHGSVIEEERRPDGTIERALTVFLSGAECPFTCSFCDLWRYTIDGPTPNGALPSQLEAVIATLRAPLPDRVKLYNASNFFDRRAVPAADVPTIARLVRGFRGVTVESHANTIGTAAIDFARQLTTNARLEIAMGLETIHPVAAARINKRLDLARFDRAARFLADNQIDLRVFVLLGVPDIPAAETVEWTVRSVAHAAERGAAVVSIIPVRGGNGEMERRQLAGEFTPPTFAQLEESLDRCLTMDVGRTVVTADLWDAERISACAHCRSARIERLRRLNVSGRVEPRVACPLCGGR